MGTGRIREDKMPLWVPVLWQSVLILSQTLTVRALKVGYYQQTTCPDAEAISRAAFSNAFQQNPNIAPALLRMHFHDCFVRGCDGSVLLDGPGTEKTAAPNLSLRGFEVVDAIKTQLESGPCAGVVSCADILAFSARDAVEMTGGQGWPVPAGRLDGRVSIAAEAVSMLPNPVSTLQQLTDVFAVKGLSQSEMLTLSGAHTIGVAHCASFNNRLYPAVDPDLDPGLAQQLLAACPQGGSANTVVNLDTVSPNQFDNQYYSNLFNRQELLTSDKALLTDFSTKGASLLNSFFGGAWEARFAETMIVMSLIEVKTGTDGEVRRNCRFVN